MLVVGLTGSIGMGKSTTASMFADLGVPVHDADATVHRLYSEPDVVAMIEAAFPGVADGGTIDRIELGKQVVGQADAMARLESMIHPLVRARQDSFLESSRQTGASYVLIDIPLLFETKAESRYDRVIVVTADAEIQRQRVMARSGMTQNRFETIVAKQMADAEKRQRADYIVDTTAGMDSARAQVHAIHEKLLVEAARSIGG